MRIAEAANIYLSDKLNPIERIALGAQSCAIEFEPVIIFGTIGIDPEPVAIEPHSHPLVEQFAQSLVIACTPALSQRCAIEPIEFEIERSDVSQCGCVYITLVFPAAFLTQADQCGEQIVEFQCLDLVLDGMLEPKIDELHSQREFGRAVKANA